MGPPALWIRSCGVDLLPSNVETGCRVYPFPVYPFPHVTMCFCQTDLCNEHITDIAGEVSSKLGSTSDPQNGINSEAISLH